MADSRTCRCQCHRQSIIEVLNFAGVDVNNAIEAVTACPTCVNNHCAALLHTRLQNEPEPHEFNPNLWTDPQPSQPDATGDKGEGAE